MQIPSNACYAGRPAVYQPPISGRDMLVLAVISIIGTLIVLVAALGKWT